MSIQNTNLSRESFLYGFKEPEKKKPRKKKLAIVGAGLAYYLVEMDTSDVAFWNGMLAFVGGMIGGIIGIIVFLVAIIKS